MYGLSNWNGFSDGTVAWGGQLNPQDWAEIRKAMTIGYTNPPVGGTAGDGSPLRPQSLDGTLKNQLQRAKHLVAYKMMPKKPGFNLVEEWNRITSYGSAGAGFYGEGGRPEEIDSKFVRVTASQKYIGVAGKVTHQAQISRLAHGPAMSIDVSAKTMALLSKVESATFWGNSAVSALEWDGLEKQITDGAPNNVVDLQGRVCTIDDINDVSAMLVSTPNWGNPTHLLVPMKIKSDLAKALFPLSRFMMSGSQNPMVQGAHLNGFDVGVGLDRPVELVGVPFLTDGIDENGGVAPTVSEGDTSKIPGTPTVSTAATSPADSSANFTAADVAGGNFAFKVIAHNQYGYSAPVSISAFTISAGDKGTFGITPAAGNTVTHYSVYRTVAGGTEARFLFRVTNSAGTGETTINDLNAFRPGCYKLFMLELSGEVLSFINLAPLIKIPFAPLDSSISYMLAMYALLAVYLPQKCAIIKNVGRPTGFVGST